MSGTASGTVTRIRLALRRHGVDPLTITADDDDLHATVYLLNGAGWRDALRGLSSRPWVESVEMAGNVHDGSILRVKLAADSDQDGDAAQQETSAWWTPALLAGGRGGGLPVDAPTEDYSAAPWRALWVVLSGVDGGDALPLGVADDDAVRRAKGPLLLYTRHPQHQAVGGRLVYVHTVKVDADARRYLALQILWHLRNVAGISESATISDEGGRTGRMLFTAHVRTDRGETSLVRELLRQVPGVVSVGRTQPDRAWRRVPFCVATEVG